MKITIRKAKASEFKQVLELINELAAFEKLAPPNKAAVNRLKKDAFGINPKFKILVALADAKIVAYAFYFFTYSSFFAKPILYLEDIYVTKKYRGFGIGKILFKELVRISKKNKCISMKWCVLNWNKKAIGFYKKLGAKPISKWIFYRMSL